MSGTQMQKVVPPRLLVPYLSGKRTVISGYVYRVQDCARLTTPRDFYHGLDLSFDGSELTSDVPELYVLRWHARDVDTYSVPYGPHMGGDWSDAPPFAEQRVHHLARARGAAVPHRPDADPGSARGSCMSPARASGRSPSTTG
ncbi:hypothetical protein ACFSTC_16375 [Nonomuraea ferruginea]